MGPGLFSPEDSRAVIRSVKHVPGLQWGRAYSARRTARWRLSSDNNSVCTSMGPGLFSPEDRRRRLQRRSVNSHFNGAGLIQPGGQQAFQVVTGGEFNQRVSRGASGDLAGGGAEVLVLMQIMAFLGVTIASGDGGGSGTEPLACRQRRKKRASVSVPWKTVACSFS